MSTAFCDIHRLGMIPYKQAWALQEQLAAEIAAGERNPTLLLLEHPHTFTFGRRGRAENLLWDEDELKRRGVEVHWVDRGGDVTYHGPGQLVGYPLLPLGVLTSQQSSPRLPQPDYLAYLRDLEAVLIRALAALGIPAAQRPGLTGVWIQPDAASRCRHCPPERKQHPAKIASIGVKVDSRGISRHGFALNVHPEMTYWQGIIACGLSDAPQISLADLLDPAPDMETVAEAVIAAFCRVFGYQPSSQPVPLTGA